MQADLLVPALAGLVTALLAGLVSHLLLVRRLRRELLEKLKFSYYEKQLTAYQKLWSLLRPTSYYYAAKDLLIVKRDDNFYLDVANVRRFYDELLVFFYSEHGIFLSKEMRTLLFDSRDFIEQLIADSKDASSGLVPLARKMRKKIQWDFNCVRVLARQDVGLPEVGMPRFRDEKDG
jgi:hypothetical protein